MEELKKLNEAFRTFNVASETLRDYYQRLQRQVAYLSEELQRKNNELRTTLSFLDSVLQGIKEAIIVLDAGGKILMMNRAAEELLMLDITSSKGRGPEEYGYDFGRISREMEIRREDGTRKVLVSLSDVLDGNDGVIGRVILLRDITVQKEMEAERERNKRLIAMGEMMASIVHELRNPLCSIELYSSMLYKELEDTPLASMAMGVSTGVRNMNNALSNMLYFARPRNPKTIPCDLDALLLESLSFIKPVMDSRGIAVRRRPVEAGVKGDPGLLKQVFLNLLLNAVQAMDSGGTLSIHPERDGGMFQVHISDTGAGIAPGEMDRIFDPFFTTRDEGTGLGLSISLKIMQAHGGTIRARSLPGSGSTFILAFSKETLLPPSGVNPPGDGAEDMSTPSQGLFFQDRRAGLQRGEEETVRAPSNHANLKPLIGGQ